jgi:hypothetical protein
MACTVGRDLDHRDRLAEAVGAPFAEQHRGLRERAHALFEEERIAFGALDETLFQRLQLGAGAEQSLEQRIRALRVQRIDTELRVVALATPPVLVLGR